MEREKTIGKLTKDEIIYAEYLKKALKSLKISQAELGKAIGKSQRTVSLYVNGDFPPSPETKALIDEYIDEKRSFSDFESLEPCEFSDLLLSLLGEFDMSQATLADAVSKSQKDISNYCCAGLNNKIVPKKVQWDILHYFYTLSKVNGQLLSDHFGTGVYLNNLLFGSNENDMYNIEAYLGDKAGYRDCITHILALPVRLQDFIAENFGAFYDNIYMLSICYGKGFSFKYISYAVELFRQLSSEKKKRLIRMLETEAIDMFPENDEELCFFKHITEYRNVISADLSELKKEDTAKRNGKEQKSFIKRLETITSLDVLSDGDFIKELDFKLAMSREEWYLWMLLVIYEFKGNNAFLFANDIIIPMIHGHK